MDKFWDNIGWILVVLFLFGGPTIGYAIGALSKTWRRTREHEHLCALKQSMIERGMSADEIERVVNAGMFPKKDED